MDVAEKDVITMTALIEQSIFLTCVSLFFDFAIQERQVLGMYRKWLNRLYQKGTQLIAKKAEQQTKIIAGREQVVNIMTPPKRKNKIRGRIYRTVFNIAGGCIYCTNPYLSIILMISMFGNFNIADWICVIGMNHVLIRIFKSKIQ